MQIKIQKLFVCSSIIVFELVAILTITREYLSSAVIVWTNDPKISDITKRETITKSFLHIYLTIFFTVSNFGNT